MDYFKQFTKRPGNPGILCGGVVLTIQNQVESIQSMLERAQQGFPIERKNVRYGEDENPDIRIDDLTDYDKLTHEFEYLKKRSETEPVRKVEEKKETEIEKKED